MFFFFTCLRVSKILVQFDYYWLNQTLAKVNSAKFVDFWLERIGPNLVNFWQELALPNFG